MSETTPDRPEEQPVPHDPGDPGDPEPTLNSFGWLNARKARKLRNRMPARRFYVTGGCS